ncbi:radical SAM/SPASM domain-containing protein [Prosthecochloris sp. GSB1]|uniref:radical SAM/SPASM domain-containing protein n=1 Tax=Prosthecochloris sp. GSB1 TaxID=281093 RepID=UPI001F3F8EF3|nr:radical SAM protein [Prosthecochloris sp. GSB1]
MTQSKISSLMLAVTRSCNLSCVYCYEGAGEAAGRPMSGKTVEKALSLVAASGKPFHVQITGGEPLLAPDTVLAVLEVIRRRRFPATVAIQTNGVLLDREMAMALKASGTAVGVSVDGLPATQETLRGQGSATWRAMKLLDSEEVPFSITTVLTSANVTGLSRLAMALHSMPSALAVGLDPLVRKGSALHEPGVQPPDPDRLREGITRLLETLDFLNRQRARPLVFRERELLLRTIGRERPGPYCQACTGSSLAVTPGGELYPCTQTMGDPAFLLGTLDRPGAFESSLSSGCAREHESCDGCELQGRCPGDCPSRLHYNCEKTPGQACTLYRTIYDYSRKKGEIA